MPRGTTTIKPFQACFPWMPVSAGAAGLAAERLVVEGVAAQPARARAAKSPMIALFMNHSFYMK
jgi:hypothetical protein